MALAAADLDAFRGWTVAVAEQAFVFLSVGAAALLVVDATIESKTAEFTRDAPLDALGDMSQIAPAVSFLVHQRCRGTAGPTFAPPPQESRLLNAESRPAGRLSRSGDD